MRRPIADPAGCCWCWSGCHSGESSRQHRTHLEQRPRPLQGLYDGGVAFVQDRQALELGARLRRKAASVVHRAERLQPVLQPQLQLKSTA
jgi:hypothetical protein